jgi:hypothetical protein
MSQKARIVFFWIPFICLVVAMVIPHLVRSRVTTAKMPCIAGLNMIDAAKRQWAFSRKKTTNDAPTWDDLRPYFVGARLPLECHDGGVYAIGRIGELPSCSIAEHTEYWRTHHP